MNRRLLEIIGIVCIVAATLVGTFFLAHYVQDNNAAQNLVEQFGYLGILALSIIIGLNLFLPIPAATLAPIFVAAGFALPAIIATVVAGSMFADGVGYLMGVGGKRIAKHAHPAFQKKMQALARRHHTLLLPFVFLYATFSPFPNELILIPLAISGIKYRVLFIPLLLGTILYEAVIAYGLTGAFHYFL